MDISSLKWSLNCAGESREQIFLTESSLLYLQKSGLVKYWENKYANTIIKLQKLNR